MSQLRKVEEQTVIKYSVYKAVVIITSLSSCLRDPAEEGGGAAGARGQTRARGERRGHHPVSPNRRGVQRLR